MGAYKTEAQVLLKEWLNDHERTVSWFGRLIGVSKTTVHSWLAGKSRPMHFHRELICDLTKIDPFLWLTAYELREHKRIAAKIAHYHRTNK